ncbi:MAG: RNB domain-containing ribonuclease [SAR324 cluster bacterium]|uniref:RNB domain-containing ribonuclease n=1 Tax=SAR324 cluster bacterium TaxID=2024889 RepID=A0A7X9FQT3_9DELT|nr:RNB domain-containing ribonuclease [SAR324 cluster bacterium]
MAAAQKTSLHSFQELAFPEGIIVTYENDGLLLVAVVLSSKNEKLILLNDRGREVELLSSRLYRLPGKMPSEHSTAEAKREYLLALREKAENFSTTINLEEIWNLLHEDAIQFSNQQLCELYFGNNELLTHLGLRFALLSDNTFFKRNKELFIPRTIEVIEELKRSKEARIKKEQLRSMALDFVGIKLKDASLPIPEELKPLFDDISDLAAFSPYLDKSREKEATDFVECAATNFELNLNGQPGKKAYDFLISLGVFNKRTNPRVIKYKVPIEFSDESILESQKIHVPESLNAYLSHDLLKRRDLTSLRTFTIDDVSTRDMDDAISLVEDGDSYTLYVHVSDVASFLTKGSHLDKEAMKRATSLYLPEQKIHMLPRSLCEEQFSLIENKIRPALTCIFKINRNFEVVGTEITPSLICVNQRYDYDEIDESILHAEHEFDLLHQIASSREAFRIANGGFKVQKRDVTIQVDENGRVCLREVDENSPAHSMVGEMMILANECIAKFCLEHKLPIPYRGQEASERDEQDLYEIPQGPAYDFAIKSKLKRSGTSFSPSPHFNLGLEIYTQATSPIRRYLDLCVQRQVMSYLFSQKACYTIGEFEEILSIVQESLTTASNVSRESKRYWLLRYLEQVAQERRTLKGVVVRTDLKTPLVELDEIFIALFARISGNPKLGDSADFRIISVDPLSDYVRLEAAGPLFSAARP